MSIATPARLAKVALTTTLTTVLYTAVGKVLVKEVILANTSASPVAATLRIGSATGVAETVIPAVSIPANSTYQMTLSLVMEAGETITAGAATGAVVGCSISGVTVA